MSFKSLIHPETISKQNLLYRGWRRLIRNRLWHGRVPVRQSICLWFWPAVFGTLIFTPILYPILIITLLPLKYVCLTLIWLIGIIFEGVWWGIRSLLSWPIDAVISFCQIKLHRRLAVGHVLMLLAGICLAFLPTVNYWVVGIVTVFLVSYIVYWIGLSLISVFFVSVWHLLAQIPMLWLTAHKYPSRQTQFWWWITLVYLLLASPVVLWRMGGVASVYQKISILGGALIGLAVGIALARRRQKRWEQDHPELVREKPKKEKPRKPQREPWTKPVRIFLSAKKNEFCPVVEFVD